MLGPGKGIVRLIGIRSMGPGYVGPPGYCGIPVGKKPPLPGAGALPGQFGQAALSHIPAGHVQAPPC